MSELAGRVADYILRHRLLYRGERVVVGVSGGADSVCLLHLLRDLAVEWDLALTVAHLNHGLRGAEADADATFVAELAQRWGLPCESGRAGVAELAEANRLSIEEAARQARYAFLAEVAARAAATRIAVGHHADDQAETVLMRFLRGSGVAGLRGMLPVMPLSDYRVLSSAAGEEAPYLVRPLLSTPRAEIEAYCAEHSLMWRTDGTNSDTRLYRNRLRHELLPALAQYNPRIGEVLARTAEVMAGDYEVLHSVAAEAFANVRLPAPPDLVVFERDDWLELPTGLQRATLRLAVRELRRNLRNINLEHIERAVEIGRAGETGAKATIAAGLGLTVDAYTLQIGPEDALPRSLDLAARPRARESTSLAAPGETRLDDGWRVEVSQFERDRLPAGWSENREGWTAYLDADAVGSQLALRPRQPGDRFRPLGLAGHTTRVNEFMINLKIPAGERAEWPLLAGAKGIAWVCGLRIDHAAAVTPATRRVWRVRFLR